MERVYLERPSASEVLRDKIIRYKRINGNRFSSAQLARKWDVTASTLNRIENCNVKNISIETCIKVFRGTGNDDEITKFLKNYYPNLHDEVMKSYVDSIKTSEHKGPLEDYFNDEDVYEIMLLASTNRGVKENYILQEYGRKVYEKFISLAARKILINEGGRFFTVEKNMYFSEKGTIKLIENIAGQLRKDLNVNEELPNSRYHLIYESINYDYLQPKISKAYKEFIFEVKKLLKDPKSEGDDFLCVGTLVNLKKGVSK